MKPLNPVLEPCHRITVNFGGASKVYTQCDVLGQNGTVIRFVGYEGLPFNDRVNWRTDDAGKIISFDVSYWKPGRILKLNDLIRSDLGVAMDFFTDTGVQYFKPVTVEACGNWVWEDLR